MNIDKYLCSTEELYLIHKVSSLNYVNFILNPNINPPKPYLYFIGPEGEVLLAYGPVYSYISFFAFTIIAGTPPDIPGFTQSFGFYPPSGKQNGRVEVKL